MRSVINVNGASGDRSEPAPEGGAEGELAARSMPFIRDGRALPRAGPDRIQLRLVAAPQIQRQSLAVLATDVAGYTRLIELDDLGTALKVRQLHRHLIAPVALAHGGRVVDQAGDGTLMAFPLASGAIKCAVEIQRRLNALELAVPEEKRMRLRMGISADEVLVIDGDLYGRAVNIAARLTALAEPGEILLSGRAFDWAKNETQVCCEPLGSRCLRNIANPVRVFRVAAAEHG